MPLAHDKHQVKLALVEQFFLSTNNFKFFVALSLHALWPGDKSSESLPVWLDFTILYTDCVRL